MSASLFGSQDGKVSVLSASTSLRRFHKAWRTARQTHLRTVTVYKRYFDKRPSAAPSYAVGRTVLLCSAGRLHLENHKLF